MVPWNDFLYFLVRSRFIQRISLIHALLVSILSLSLHIALVHSSLFIFILFVQVCLFLDLPVLR